MNIVRSVEESVKDEDSESNECEISGGGYCVKIGEEKFTLVNEIKNFPVIQVLP